VALLVVDVGDRAGWKSKRNLHPFRADEQLQLTCVPTLLGWAGEAPLSLPLNRISP
jgi:hypothetical protein